MVKTGLKIRDVDKNHWSANKKQIKPSVTQVTVRVLEGKSLLASDTETGKSDPQCFVWLCSDDHEDPDLDLAAALANNSTLPPSSSPMPPLLEKEEQENEDNENMNNNDTNESNKVVEPFSPERPAPTLSVPVLLSKVCYTTTDPQWNDDLTFPIDLYDVPSLVGLKIKIVVRDEDDVEGKPGDHIYDDLGCVEIPLRNVITQGRVLKNSICDIGRRYDLQKTKTMRRVDGYIKVTVTLTFADDAKRLFPELADGINSVEKFTEMLVKVE
jgi:hypothetical protein